MSNVTEFPYGFRYSREWAEQEYEGRKADCSRIMRSYSVFDSSRRPRFAQAAAQRDDARELLLSAARITVESVEGI